MDQDARLKVLKEAGWKAGRRTSTAAAKRALVDNGFAYWSELAVFLTEYDGLTLRFVRRSGGPDAIKLDACWAATVADSGWMTRYGEHASARLAPVGAAYSEHLLIWLADDGRDLGTYAALVGELGRTPDDMLNTLLDDRVELRDPDVT